MNPCSTLIVAVLVGSASIATAIRHEMEHKHKEATLSQKLNETKSQRGEGEANLCVIEERGVVTSMGKRLVVSHGFKFEFPVDNCSPSGPGCNPYTFFSGGKGVDLFKRAMVVGQIANGAKDVDKSKLSKPDKMACTCSFDTDLLSPESKLAKWDASFAQDSRPMCGIDTPPGHCTKVRESPEDCDPTDPKCWCNKKACWRKYSWDVMEQRIKLEKKAMANAKNSGDSGDIERESLASVRSTGLYADTFLFDASHFKQGCTNKAEPKVQATLFSPNVAAKNARKIAMAAGGLADEKDESAMEKVKQAEQDIMECPECKNGKCDEDGTCIEGCPDGWWGAMDPKMGPCTKRCPQTEASADTCSTCTEEDGRVDVLIDRPCDWLEDDLEDDDEE